MCVCLSHSCVLVSCKAVFGGMGIRGAETPVTVVGPNIVSDDGGEANLDIQYIMGVARGIPTTFWSIKANSTIEIGTATIEHLVVVVASLCCSRVPPTYCAGCTLDDILKWGYQVSNSSNPPQINSLSCKCNIHPPRAPVCFVC